MTAKSIREIIAETRRATPREASIAIDAVDARFDLYEKRFDMIRADTQFFLSKLQGAFDTIERLQAEVKRLNVLVDAAYSAALTPRARR